MSPSTLAAGAPTLPFAVAPPSREASLRGRKLWRRLAFGMFGWRPRKRARDADPAVINGALIACLADLPAIDTRALCQLLTHARSVAELWHLRPEVFRVLSLYHSQAEAERRLSALNPLFDRR